MKSILFFINSLAFGGSEQQTIDLINSISSKKYNIALIFLNDKKDLLHKLSKKLIHNECLFKKGKFDFHIIIKLKRIIKKHNIDTVFCVNENTFFYAYICKKIYNLNFRLITVIHHIKIRPGNWEFLKQEIYRRLLNNSNAIVFVSNNQLNFWVNKYKINKTISTVIHNGIYTNKFVNKYTDKEIAVMRKQIGFNESDFLVGICAGLRPEKRHFDFIQGIIKANKENPKIKGLIVGDGPEYNKINNYIKRHRLDELIVMVGYQPDVRPWLSISDCMSLTSSIETFSISALESMAMGKPIVITNIGGSSELVDPGKNGYLFEPGDVNSFSKHLLKLIDVFHRKILSENSKKTVRENFTINHMSKKYEILFDQA